MEDPTAVPQFRTVDIVLDCSYVWDGGLLHGFGASLSKHPATLVLRGISVRDDGSLGDVTDYEVPRETPDSTPPIIFEASGEWESWGKRAASRVLTIHMHQACTKNPSPKTTE